MNLIGKTSQPIGHYEFCQRNPQLCTVQTTKEPVVQLNRKTWSLLKKVNDDVNSKIAPASDMDLYGREEYWTYAENAGDCEDYVLNKQRALQEQGIASSNLLITVVLQPNGEGHAVLTVRTNQGDIVLDSLRNEIYNWKDTEYTYLKRQDENNQGQWAAIEQTPEILVSSVAAH